MGFAFSVDNSRFLFENFWQFGIARVYETVAFGEMQILLIKSEICHIFHVNIILKLLTEYVTDQ